MKEKSPRKREGKTLSSLRYAFHAITVGSGKHAEPYIIAFHHKSDNVAGRTLGTLFGFFEVEVHDEDAAYIVNFLASVAKKEYFANPRREVEDGFETTLHKVNVALAEIAKEGNISWLGHLHGVIAAISHDTMYFSATGDGVLSLSRDEMLRPISDGLADSLSEPHPLKTFTEVASGKLMDHDVLLALSPAVWTLFTPDDLKRNLARLGPEAFEQFLRTALINELPIAGAVMVSITSESLPAPKKETTSPETATTLENVWSGRTFEQARIARIQAAEQSMAAKAPAAAPEREKEYIDTKTGHIYLQGETETAEASTNQLLVRLAFWSQTFSHRSQIEKEKFYRFGRRTRKNLGFWWREIGTHLGNLGRHIGRRSRSLLRHWREVQAKRKQAREALRPTTPQVPPVSPTTPVQKEAPSPITLPAIASTLPRMSEIKGRLARFAPSMPSLGASSQPQREIISSTKPAAWKTAVTSGIGWMKQRTTQITQFLKHCFTRLTAWWQGLNQFNRSRTLGIGVIVLALGLGTFFYLNRSTLWDTPLETPAITPPPDESVVAKKAPETDEPLANRLADGRVLATPGKQVIALTTLNGTPFGITADQVVNIQTSEAINTPETIRLATAMDDLDALFLLGTSGTLHMYTIANKKFTPSTLPLPAEVTVDAIGVYLTYLYVLDREAGTLYRFPRAEGGFGTPTQWSRETFKLSRESPLVVSDSIALIGEDNTLGLYERGQKTSTTFGGTTEPLTIKAFTFDQTTGDVLVLDPSHERIVRWSPSGILVAQYFHTSFGEASGLLTTSNNALLIVRPSGVFTFQLP